MMAEYIDKQAALDALTHNWDGMVTSVFDVVKGLPVADVQPVRRGHWEKIGNHTCWGLYECSECHLISSIYCWCPNCGARMDGAT